jgi:hypothetical protein
METHNKKKYCKSIFRLRIKKTVYPPSTVASYNEWSMWFWGLYAKSIEKSKNDWSRNEYKPKIK